MKIIDDIDLEHFDAWSGAVSTKDEIIANDKATEFECMIDELYPDGITAVELNDILWFEADQILEDLGIKKGDDE